MKTKLFLCLTIAFLFALCLPLYAQEWASTYGGTGYDYAWHVQQTTDGGYIVAGSTESFGAGNSDFWVMKLDASGNVSWQKTYGGTGNDYVFDIRQTADGGYVVAGDTESFGAGSSDVWVMKLDASGNVSWQKTYGGTDYDEADAVRQTLDHGYIISGQTYSAGAGNNSDSLLIKIDASGNIAWQKTYGGTGYDDAWDIQQTHDGGYIVAGDTESFGAGSSDVWVMKLDASGNVSWQKTYGGTGSDSAYAIRLTSDGGYVVAGQTESFGAGSSDIWVIKLDASGNIVWQKTYGGAQYDDAYAIRQTPDNGYILAGDTESFGAGSSDIWVIKLDASGNVSWQKTYGGTKDDFASDIQLTSDGGYVVAGQTYSFGAGDSDGWVLKLDGNGNITDCFGNWISIATVAETRSVPSVVTASGIASSISHQDSNAAVSNTSITNSQVCYAESPLMPLPMGQQSFTDPASVSPVLSTAPAQAQPIGVGDIATGGPNLAINVAVGQFETPVDVYFFIFIPAIDSHNIYQFTSAGLLQKVSAGLAPWISGTAGPVSKTLFGSLPVSGLPPGMYYLAVAVMPAGDQSLGKYYLWVAEFPVGLE